MKETLKITTDELEKLRKFVELEENPELVVAMDDDLKRKLHGLMVELDSHGLLDESTEVEDLVKEAVTRGLDAMFADFAE